MPAFQVGAGPRTGRGLKAVHIVAKLVAKQALGRAGRRAIAPLQVLAEIAGAIARRTGQPELAEAAVNQIQRLPGLRLVPLDANLAKLAADLAGRHSLRGADAVYVATAQRLKVLRVTLDDEQLRRSRAVVTTLEPD